MKSRYFSIIAIAFLTSLCTNVLADPLLIEYIDGLLYSKNLANKDQEARLIAVNPSHHLVSPQWTKHLIFNESQNVWSIIDVNGCCNIPSLLEPAAISNSGKIFFKTSQTKWEVMDGNKTTIVPISKGMQVNHAKFADSGKLVVWGIDSCGNHMLACFNEQLIRVYEKKYGCVQRSIENVMPGANGSKGLVLTSTDTFKDAFYPFYNCAQRVLSFATSDSGGVGQEINIAILAEPIETNIYCSVNGRFAAVTANNQYLYLIDLKNNRLIYATELMAQVGPSSHSQITDILVAPDGVVNVLRYFESPTDSAVYECIGFDGKCNRIQVVPSIGRSAKMSLGDGTVVIDDVFSRCEL